MVLTNEKGNISSDLYSELNTPLMMGNFELGMIMAVLVGVAKIFFCLDLVRKRIIAPFSFRTNPS
ncbi:MAG: hypothetical protein Ct9H90mP13_08080 [Pseudomonadota bacterium]|nr:MAG: hypothetical protein Ct9H90mP13_08080 [Pseudomonadota bacterium]